VPILLARSEEPLFHADASYLVTGGFGGFGLEVAKWMVDEGARNLVLVGRRGAASVDAQESIRQLQDKGAQVLTAAVDVTQESQLATLLDEIANTMPPLRGVMHGAMVLDDGLIPQLDPIRFARVMAPKAVGAWNLHKLTQRLPLDFFTMFSSVAVLVGNPAQGSYVAANSFLDALAHYRRGLGLPGTSINWGVLAEVGVASRDAALQQYLEHVGMKSVTMDMALTALGRVLRTQPTQIGIMDMDWQRWGQAVPPAAHSTRLARLIGAAETADGGDDPVVQFLMTMTPEEREAELTVLLAEEVSGVLRMPLARLDAHQPLSRMGVDSLITVELQVAIQNRFRVEVSALELMKGVSVAQLAQQILAKMNIPTAPATVPPVDASAGKILEKESI
jgi:acyl carrier protein